MAEYIEREALEVQINKAQTSLESTDDKVWKRNKPFYKGLCWARAIINEQPTADVVPKSEVEYLVKALEKQQKLVIEKEHEIGKLEGEIEQLFEEIDEIKKKQTGIDCPKCKHFVGCEKANWERGCEEYEEYNK